MDSRFLKGYWLFGVNKQLSYIKRKIKKIFMIFGFLFFFFMSCSGTQRHETDWIMGLRLEGRHDICREPN